MTTPSARASLAAFWSGPPFVLGPAAVVLGLLGSLVTLAAIAAVVIDQTT